MFWEAVCSIGLYGTLVSAYYIYSGYRESSKTAKRLSKGGLLDENSVLWDVACGRTGLEALGWEKYVYECYGIDPKLIFNRKIGKTMLLKRKMEDVLNDKTIPRPDLVFSKRFSGMHKVIGKLLEFDTEPTVIMSPCTCSECKRKYFADRPLSPQLRKKHGDKSYLEIDKNDPVRISLNDITFLAKSLGYNSALYVNKSFVSKQLSKISYELIVSKRDI